MNCPKCNREIPDDASVCPYCASSIKSSASPKADETKKKKKKFPIWVIPVVIVLIIIGNFANPANGKEAGTSQSTDSKDVQTNGSDSPTDAAKNVAATTNSEPQFDFEFDDIMTLIDEYKTNEVAADKKYKDKIVKVTGKVTDIGKDILNSVYICVNDGTEITWDYAQCYFSDNNEIDKVAELSVGDNVTLYGKVSNYNLTLSLKRCVLAE